MSPSKKYVSVNTYLKKDKDGDERSKGLLVVHSSNGTFVQLARTTWATFSAQFN